jgi:hypothetical protein
MKRLAIFALFLLVLYSFGYSTTYYVDTASTHGGDGTTIATTGANRAWDAIADVNGASFNAGDSILFKRGCTWRETLTPPSSGSIGLPITFGKYGTTGAGPIIDGTTLITPGTSWTADTTIYSDTFESGDLTGWTESDASGYISASSAVAHGGTYSALFDFTGSNESYLRRIYTTALTNVSFYFWIYFDSTTAPSLPFLARNAGGDWCWYLDFSYSSSAHRVHLHAKNDADAAAGNTATYAVGASGGWHKIGVNVINATGTGGSMELVIDGVSQETLSGFATSNRLLKDFTFSSDYTGVKFYIDDVTASVSGQANTWNATVTTQPYVVWFDGTLGTLQVNKAAVNAANEWFWAANVLSVYSTTDPDTAYTSPGIEVSARNNVYANGLTYLTFDGITFTRGGNDATGSSAFKLRNCQNITIQNCDITESTGIGIDIYTVAGTTGDVLIDHCDFSDTGQGKISADANSAIQTYNTGDTPTFTVQYCTFRDIDNFGAYHGHGIYHFSGKLICRYNFHYGDNAIWPKTSGAAVRLQSTGGANVYYNIFTDIDGTRVWGICGGGGTNNIYNNIFYGCGTALYTGGGGTETYVVKNNIFYGKTATYEHHILFAGVVTGYTGANNDFYLDSGTPHWHWEDIDKTTIATWATASGESIYLTSDPLFVSIVTPDFHLLPTSPCINAGVNVGLTQDYEGTTVPQDNAVDIGAYEYWKKNAIFIFIGRTLPWLTSLF